MTITEFLEARIAEDATLAAEATPGPWVQSTAEAAADTVIFTNGGTWVTNIDNCPAVGQHQPTPGGSVCPDQAIPNGDHIARHDPARVLAECEAKRRIVENERWRPWPPAMECAGHPGPFMPHGDYGEDYCFAAGPHQDGLNENLRALAAVYADHPDYDQEWAL